MCPVIKEAIYSVVFASFVTGALLLLASGVGCEPVNEAEGAAPRRASKEQVLDDYGLEAYVLTVDGIEYIVVADAHGLAICPKVFPTSNPESN